MEGGGPPLKMLVLAMAMVIVFLSIFRIRDKNRQDGVKIV